MFSNSNDGIIDRQSQKSHTENGALAYETTGSRVLDLFACLNRDQPVEQVRDMVTAAWLESAYNVMRVLFYTRDCRRGKGERRVSYIIMRWLYENHKSVFARHLPNFVLVGYYKDLLNLYMGLKDCMILKAMCAQLWKDSLDLNMNPSASISLAAKWAPSECSRRYGEIARKCARRMFPSSKCPQKEYRQLVAKLRRRIETVESLMCARKWEDIKFCAVPATAHKNYKAAFLKQQNERYTQYLADLKAGKTTIKTSGLQPHQIVRSMCMAQTDDERNMLELAWRAMIEDFTSMTSKTHQNTVCVIDVSGSMDTDQNPRPIDVSVSLGLMCAEVCVGQFHNKVITFSAKPEVVDLSDCRDLRARINKVRLMEWGMNTDIERVFDLIRAYDKLAAPTNRISRVIVLTDMQFDEAATQSNEVLHDHIARTFKHDNLEIPQLVYWNLSSIKNNTFPVSMNKHGACMVSGYSAAVLRALNECDTLNPYEVMERILEPYSKLVNSRENM